MLGIVSADIMGIMVLLIIYYAMLRQDNGMGGKNKKFCVCVLVCAAALLFDALMHIGDSILHPGVLLLALHVICDIFPDLMMCAFGFYMYDIISEDARIKDTFARTIAIICAADIVVTLVLAVMGKSYVYRNDMLQKTALGEIEHISALICMLILFVTIIVSRKYISKEKFVVVLIYVSVPALIGAFEINVSHTNYYMPFMALVFLMTYVVIQTGSIEEGRIREEILKEMTIIDEMTGLGNRRAFFESKERVLPFAGLGVAFCDLNNLKHVNDTKGHAAGDELIISFATTLRKYFRDSDLYRISGDEFVIFVKNVSRELFETRMINLTEELDENAMAEVGFIYGIGSEADDLIKIAEDRMYVKKQYAKDCGRAYVR